MKDLFTTGATPSRHLHLASLSLAQIEGVFDALVVECQGNEPNQAVAGGLILQILGLLQFCPGYSTLVGISGDAQLYSAVQYLDATGSR